MRNHLGHQRIALPLLALLCSGSALMADETLRETFSKTYPLTATGRVSLDNINGAVRIDVWDRAELKIEAVKQASSAECLKELEIDVRASADSIDITTEYPDHSHHHHSRSHDSESVDYTLTVPRRASIEKIDLVNGDLAVTGAEGGIEADLVNGRLTGSGLAGTVRIDTVNGEVELKYDRLSAKDRIEIQSVNGRIELLLSATAGARLRANTLSGHLSNDFGIEVDRHRVVGADMDGTIGNGGADITLESVSGSIAVRKP